TRGRSRARRCAGRRRCPSAPRHPLHSRARAGAASPTAPRSDACSARTRETRRSQRARSPRASRGRCRALGSASGGPAAREVAREVDGIADCVRQIDEAGVQVKDLDEGLLDFPARRGHEDVLLCWKVGEPEVAFWHGLEEGFAGRKPLPEGPDKAEIQGQTKGQTLGGANRTPCRY